MREKKYTFRSVFFFRVRGRPGYEAIGLDCMIDTVPLIYRASVVQLI